MDDADPTLSANRPIVLAKERPFRLGAVEVRPSTRELIGPGGRVILEPQVMKVLVALARADGEILTREDLTQSCWEGRVVGEDALSRVISHLRRATEGVGRDGWSLETITKVGYRLLPVGQDADMVAARLMAQPKRGFDRRWLLAAGGVAAAAGATAGAAGAVYWLSRPRIPAEARDLYAKGLEALKPGLPEDNQQAQGFLREAVAKAPDFAPAWGALALAYQGSLLFTEPSRQAGVTAQAEAAARRALDLDPNEAQAAAALALMADVYRDWARVEALYRRALTLHARDPQVEFVYARLLLGVGRLKDAVPHAQAAVAGDPFAVWHRHTLGISLWSAGRTEEAEGVLTKALARWPRHYALWFQKLHLLVYSGRADQAVAMGADLGSRPINIPEADIELSLSAARALASGAADAVKAAADAQLAAAKRGAGYAENAISFLSAAGRLDDAFATARAMYFAAPPPGGQRFSSGRFVVGRRRQTYILFLPSTAAMRADKRFPALMADLGLPEYWRASGHPPDDQAWVPA